ncbi:hypothetical protein EG850_11100 [Gulosibacter macacae]|uniref:Uncharacterized protein n=1 Tax=Gulosibacter macacae TaxID=2488791 RepID=A0A3P3VT38_9MICO|nr:hypothetical protein [Gulosibacter macacae]RRJ85925.1 hypothetical protein EG850_11100 [Gulosibacter macacae]
MTERIDHAAEAREALGGSGDGRNFATDASQNAIAHALLAIAEQQRIATLIALATLTDVDTDGDKLRADAMDRLVRWVPHGPDDEHPEMRPEIAAVLGIKTKETPNAAQ